MHGANSTSRAGEWLPTPCIYEAPSMRPFKSTLELSVILLSDECNSLGMGERTR